MVISRFIFNDNPFAIFAYFTFIPKTGVGLPQTGIITSMFVGIMEVLEYHKNPRLS